MLGLDNEPRCMSYVEMAALREFTRQATSLSCGSTCCKLRSCSRSDECDPIIQDPKAVLPATPRDT